MLALMPNGLSRERTAISRAYGAEVRIIGDCHVNDALAEVRKLGNLTGTLLDEVVAVESAEAVQEMRRLAREHGTLSGHRPAHTLSLHENYASDTSSNMSSHFYATRVRSTSITIGYDNA
ncbi:hypothetical protein NTGBS_440072 [Candidatus Nitrotoga sp. BS]|uniref:hypothetical protein n=1 Tax=Candidatus Nitrotoga sp. BS TaxID=2890408 RepID=UPI001EF1F55A|nr:hypothetical protein [Candidatus Nitrotoga sp. BS]CAH1201391.1 hypothetical protein NTGBS_440072 [Candidatus Nitrotoga sp. BS]